MRQRDRSTATRRHVADAQARCRVMQIEPTILDCNGVMKCRVLVRRDGKVIDAETLTVESSRSRKPIVRRLAEKTGESAESIEQQILALLNQRPEPVVAEDVAELLAKMSADVREAAEAMLR